MQQNNLLELTNQVVEMLPLAEWVKSAADGGAATVMPETPMTVIGSVDTVAIPVANMVIYSAAALSADPNSYAAVNIFKRTAGGAAVLLAQGSTTPTGSGGTGNWSQWTPVTVTAQAGATVAPGDGLSISVTKAGAGVAVPICSVSLFTQVK